MPFFEFFTYSPSFFAIFFSFGVYVRIFPRWANCSMFLILPVNDFRAFSVSRFPRSLVTIVFLILWICRFLTLGEIGSDPSCVMNDFLLLFSLF